MGFGSRVEPGSKVEREVLDSYYSDACDFEKQKGEREGGRVSEGETEEGRGGEREGG